jgi:hypothetical protein
MGWFRKEKVDPGVEAVQRYSNAVYSEIEEAKKILCQVTVFDPRDRRHVKLAELIMSLTSHIPETRCADTRSLDWSDSKLGDFVIKVRRLDRVDWFSYGRQITFRDQLVLVWENSSETGEQYKMVRLGPWCHELFEIVRKIRQEIDLEVVESHRERSQKKAQFEATRFQPIN